MHFTSSTWLQIMLLMIVERCTFPTWILNVSLLLGEKYYISKSVFLPHGYPALSGKQNFGLERQTASKKLARILFLDILQTQGLKYFMTESIVIKKELFSTARWMGMRQNGALLFLSSVNHGLEVSYYFHFSFQNFSIDLKHIIRACYVN